MENAPQGSGRVTIPGSVKTQEDVALPNGVEWMWWWFGGLVDVVWSKLGLDGLGGLFQLCDSVIAFSFSSSAVQIPFHPRIHPP